MQREKLWSRIGLFLAMATWVFLLVALGSFHPTDWPSHDVYPYSPTANLCGAVGAFVAYWAFLAIGQGVFPILFFSGICLTIALFRHSIGDLWLRIVGLLLLSAAFAALIHHFQPGTANGFPEGQGGIFGIAAASFLQSHFSTIGTRLILTTALLVGLLLAADDLVLRAPGLVGGAIGGIREHAPRINWRFVPIPRLPSLPGFITRDAAARNAASASAKHHRTPTRGPGVELDPVPLARSTRDDAIRTVVAMEEPIIDLQYDDDEPAPPVDEVALVDESDPGPSAPATVPPKEQQAVVRPAPIISSGRSAMPAAAAAPVPAEPTAPPVDDATAQASAPATDEPALVENGSATDRQAEKPDPLNNIVVRLPNAIKPRQSSPPSPPKELGEYHLPPWDCLAEPEHGFAEAQEQFVREQAAILEQALREFQIEAHVVEIDTGPVITMYEISLAPGIKVSQITALSNDIARALAATSVRIVAPVPGKNTVGIEVPNAQKEKVRFKDLMQLAPQASGKMMIPLYLGKDASGEPLIADLSSMPHCLIAGTTGSGKSVCINTIIMSIMYTQRPDYVKLILVDPKVVEMAPFKDIPHLMCPVINDTGRATSVLEWACEKMDERYEFLAEAGVRNIAGYNKLTREELIERFKPESPEEEAKIPKHLPYVVVIIDELADLMMTSGKEVEHAIVRLAQKARAVGIHLIVATQRPQATVVTGLIKSNMPSKIAFRMNSKMDSRIVLDQNGAEVLLGQGDMLYLPPGASKPIRSQGTFVDDKEIRDSVKLVRSMAEAQYEPELVQIKGKVGLDGEMEKDELFDDAVRIVLETKRGSVSLLQRRLTIGYSRASRLIEMMAQSGIVGDYKGSQAREAMLTLEEWDAMKAAQEKDVEEGMTV